MSRVASIPQRLPAHAGLSVPPAGPSGLAATEVPWFDDPGSLRGSEDEVWMVSYMDIMTLLLTLFVLLFVYAQAVAPEPGAGAGAQASAQRVEGRRETTAAQPEPAVAALEVERPVLLPPQWLGYLVEPPIPELTIPLGDAAEEAAVTNPAADAGETSAAEVTVERTAAEEPVSHALATVPVAEPAAVLAAAPEAAAQTPDPTPEARGAAAPDQEAHNDLLAAIEASDLGRRVEVTRRQDAVQLEISDEILFDRASAEVRPGGEALLAELARLLAQQALTISVEGHTDNVPIRNARFASNWELSAARATTVTRQLIAHAVDPARVRAVGHADTRPRADNVTAEGRARNRRVSLVLQLPAVAGSRSE